MDRWLLWKAIALVGIAGSSFVGQIAWGEITLEDNKSGKVSVRQGDTWGELPPDQADKNPGSSPSGLPGDSRDQDHRHGLPAGQIGMMIVLLVAGLAAAAAAARKKRTQTEQKQETGGERP